MSIDFFCCNTGEIPYYLPIYKHLKNAKMVVLSSRYDCKRTKRYLEKLNIPYQTFPSKDATVVVATQIKKEPWMLERWKDIPKVRVIYSLCEKQRFHTTRFMVPFDLVLSPGPYTHKIALKYTKSVIVGYPRYDDYFNLLKREDVLKELNLNLDKNKKTILYIPTSEEKKHRNSIANFYKEIIKLSEEYNVIFKPHIYTDYWEKNLINLFKNSEVKVVDAMTELDKLLIISDIVIGDCQSGVPWECAIINKPCIACINKSDIPFEHLEVPIKDGEIMPIVKDPHKLKEAIKNINQNSFMYYKWLKKVCPYNDGKSGKMAADAIMELVKNG